MFERARAWWQRITRRPPASEGTSPDRDEERRGWERLPSSAETTLTPVDSNAQPVPARVRNVSQGGIQVVAACSFEPGAMLRVSVEGGGCSGFQYKFDIERAKAADDLVLTRDNAVVLIDPVSVNYMAGSQIDFVDDLIGQSFKINNPKATASCGCGTSFSI